MWAFHRLSTQVKNTYVTKLEKILPQKRWIYLFLQQRSHTDYLQVGMNFCCTSQSNCAHFDKNSTCQWQLCNYSDRDLLSAPRLSCLKCLEELSTHLPDNLVTLHLRLNVIFVARARWSTRLSCRMHSTVDVLAPPPGAADGTHHIISFSTFRFQVLSIP